MRGRRTAASDSPGGRNRGSRRPPRAQRERPPERVPPRESALSAWAAGAQVRTQGQGCPPLVRSWLLLAQLGSLFPHPSVLPSLHPHGLAPIGVSPPSAVSLQLSPGRGDRRPGLSQPSIRPAVLPLGASEGLQTLSVPGGQGLTLQLHQAWQEEPYQGCLGNGPQTDPDRLSEVPPTKTHGGGGGGSKPRGNWAAFPPPPRPHAPCQSLGLAVQRHCRQEGQCCPLPGACVLWGRRANTEEGTRSDLDCATGRGVV